MLQLQECFIKLDRHEADHFVRTAMAVQVAPHHSGSTNRNRKDKPHQLECATCGKCFLTPSKLARHELIHTPGHRPFQCPHNKCASSFLLKDNMNKHVLRIHKKEKPHRCKICGKAFVTGVELRGHSPVHSDAKPEICLESGCGRKFGSRSSLRAHKTRWHGNGQGNKDVCEICEKKFWCRKDLLEHIRTRTDDKPCACQLCPSAFASSSNLLAHIKRMHTGEKEHECEVCHKRFVTAKESRGHARVHLPLEARTDFLFPCDMCSKSLSSKYAKKIHMLNFHVDEAVASARAFGCPGCGKKFKTKSHLKDHQKTHVPTSDRPSFPCVECGKSFTTRGSLVSHSRIHIGKRPYTCSYCSKTFRLNALMAKHVAYKHTKERPHGCTLCRADFVTLGDLKRHLASVHDHNNNDAAGKRQRWKCEKCGMELSTRGSLAMHKARKHTNDDTAKKHSCSHPECSWGFLTATELRCHQQSHKDEKPFACPLCPSTFSTSATRTNHVRRIHTREKGCKCEVAECRKSFVTRMELKSHSLVHEQLDTIKLLTCPICDHSFKTRKGKELHIRSKHLNERPYTCDGDESCEYETASASNFRRHKTHVHGLHG